MRLALSLPSVKIGGASAILLFNRCSFKEKSLLILANKQLSLRSCCKLLLFNSFVKRASQRISCNNLSRLFVAFIVVNFLVFFFSKKSILFCIALGLHYLCTSKATGKRVQKKFTYFAEREWFRETEPPGIECKRSLLILPSVSGFVKQSHLRSSAKEVHLFCRA